MHPDRYQVTLYHWDLPQALQDIGGWPNDRLVEFFEDYAEVAFVAFGDRVCITFFLSAPVPAMHLQLAFYYHFAVSGIQVKWWITFNEPLVTCAEGYGMGEMAPGIKSNRRADYMCTHTILKSHARAYRLYRDKFKASQGGEGTLTSPQPTSLEQSRG